MTTDNRGSKTVDVRARIGRREFIAGAGVAAMSFSIVKPESVRGSQANSKITVGLSGCGTRGTWIAGLFMKHGGFQIVAGADYFEDKVNAFGEKLQVETGRRYTGLSGCKKMLESKPDAIAVESPPWFHPEQAAAGVDAGVHVFLAKPVAVDVPGCRTVEESARKATAAKLCFRVDFQTRMEPNYREAVTRVQGGDIGTIISGEALYVCGPTWGGQGQFLRADPTNPENRLRAWGLDRALSGDIITEQNIHALDVATWILDAHPVRAGERGATSAIAATIFPLFTRFRMTSSLLSIPSNTGGVSMISAAGCTARMGRSIPTISAKSASREKRRMTAAGPTTSTRRVPNAT